MKNLTFILLSVILIASCKPPKLSRAEHKEAFFDLKWIVGEWEKKYNFGKVYEKWEKENDSTNKGISKLIYNKGYEPYSDKYEIAIRNGKVTFTILNLTDEKTNKPQQLELIKWKKHELMFLNEAASEFPQKISYKLTTDKKLNVSNSGTDDGKSEKDEHLLEKIN